MEGAGSAGEPHRRRPRARDAADGHGRRPGAGSPADPHGRRPATDGSNEPRAPGSDARSAEDPSARTRGTSESDAGDRGDGGGQTVRGFLRANPQVLVLLVICLVLGIGTFVVVLIGLVTAGSDQTTGEPSGAVLGTHSLFLARSLML